jgi:hypothetical protein
MPRQGEKGASPQDGCAGQRHRLHAIARLEALAEPPRMAKPKTPAAGSASGERDSLVQTSKLFLTFPSRERIGSAFVGALAHFLSPPSSATEWQSVRVVFGNIRHVHMPADCAADALSGGIVIIPARSTMLRSTVGRFDSGGKCNYLQAHPRKAAEHCSHDTSFHYYRPSGYQVRCAAKQKIQRRPHTMGHVRSIPRCRLPIFRRFDLFGRHPKRSSCLPPLEFIGANEGLYRPASELTGHRRLRSRCTIALRLWKLRGDLRCCLPKLRAGQ